MQINTRCVVLIAVPFLSLPCCSVGASRADEVLSADNQNEAEVLVYDVLSTPPIYVCTNPSGHNSEVETENLRKQYHHAVRLPLHRHVRTPITFVVDNVNTLKYRVKIDAGSESFIKGETLPGIIKENLVDKAMANAADAKTDQKEGTTPTEGGGTRSLSSNQSDYNKALTQFLDTTNRIANVVRLDELLRQIALEEKPHSQVVTDANNLVNARLKDISEQPGDVSSALGLLYEKLDNAFRDVQRKYQSVISSSDGVLAAPQPSGEDAGIPAEHRQLADIVNKNLDQSAATSGQPGTEANGQPTTTDSVDWVKDSYRSVTRAYDTLTQARSSLETKANNADTVYRSIAAARFWVQAPITPDASTDEVTYKLTFTRILDDAGNPTSNGSSEELANVARVDMVSAKRINFSAGVLFTGLSSPSYTADPVPGKDNTWKIRETNHDKYTPILGSLVHAYLTNTETLQTAVSFGLGLDANQRVRYFVGPSLAFGDRKRAVLSFGLAGGQVEKLDMGGSKVGDEIGTNTIHTRTGTDTAFFVGLTFNLQPS